MYAKTLLDVRCKILCKPSCTPVKWIALRDRIKERLRAWILALLIIQYYFGWEKHQVCWKTKFFVYFLFIQRAPVRWSFLMNSKEKSLFGLLYAAQYLKSFHYSGLHNPGKCCPCILLTVLSRPSVLAWKRTTSKTTNQRLTLFNIFGIILSNIFEVKLNVA